MAPISRDGSVGEAGEQKLRGSSVAGAAGCLSAAETSYSHRMGRCGSMGVMGVSLRLAVLCAMLAPAAGEVSGRWRYGSISWRRSDPNDLTSNSVVITVERCPSLPPFLPDS